jgi:hypothetical protein
LKLSIIHGENFTANLFDAVDIKINRWGCVIITPFPIIWDCWKLELLLIKISSIPLQTNLFSRNYCPFTFIIGICIFCNTEKFKVLIQSFGFHSSIQTSCGLCYGLLLHWQRLKAFNIVTDLLFYEMFFWSLWSSLLIVKYFVC